MPLTPTPPIVLDETLSAPYIPPGSIQAGLPAIVDADTIVTFKAPYTPDQQMKTFNEKLILEIQTQKIAIAQLKSENSYLKSQIAIIQNQQPQTNDTLSEVWYLT